MLKQIHFQDGNILYITDSPSQLEKLKSEGSYVIPLYTAENSGLEFPHTEYAISDINELFEMSAVPDIIDASKARVPEYIIRIYRRLAHIPWDILETDRLSVREMTASDVDAFYEIYSDTSITEYMEGLFDNPEDERLYTRNYIRDIYGFYGYGLWTVIEKASGSIIGRAGISNRDGYTLPELGFVIGKAYQHKGYAFEVCSAILNYAEYELGFKAIQALIMPENSASIRLIRRLGFSRHDTVGLNSIPHIRFIRSV